MSGLRIRPIANGDYSTVATLFQSIGFDSDSTAIAHRLKCGEKGGDMTLVAQLQGGVAGCMGLARMHPAHREHPIGRITVLVVAEDQRGLGIGKALVGAAMELFTTQDCTLIEVTSRFELEQAHGFYEALGFEKTSVRLARHL
ncbi:GNAT family N-acetyltransferase [Qipengyuania sp. MTN3-11]|uniref:GNAT family N-acetyltransferase n=1 Tax=Qipengyuania sp. MTN3-11 TaxID=3056557 RepID=UPI0036F2CA42